MLPVEVKSGAAGTLKSLHRFLAGSKGVNAVRLSSSPGKTEELEASLGGDEVVRYTLRSIPLYLAELVATL